MHKRQQQQKGAALVTALVFLLVITLLSVSGMRTSTLELKMANNEQLHAEAVQSSESALDAVVSAADFTTGSVGDVTCYNAPAGATDCTASKAISGTGYNSDNYVRVTLATTGNCPRKVASSGRGRSSLRTGTAPKTSGSCAYFDIDSLYDGIDAGGGRAEVVRGVSRVIY